MKKLILASLAAVTLAGCPLAEQPAPPCLTAHGGYAVRYIATTPAPGTACDMKGDIIGVQKFNQEDGTMNVVMRPILTTDTQDNEAILLDPRTYAVGTFEDEKPADGFCTIPTFTDATAQALVTNASDQVEEGTLTYTFENARFYVTGRSAGYTMEFDVTISDTGCTAKYHGVGMNPIVACTTLADCAFPDHVWSGGTLNPDFDVVCTEDSSGNAGMFCTPAKDELPTFCPEGGCQWRIDAEAAAADAGQ